MTHYTGVKTEIIKEDVRGDYRCVVLHAPLRTKHNHWIVATQRKHGKEWLPVSDREYSDYLDAATAWLDMVNRAVEQV